MEIILNKVKSYDRNAKKITNIRKCSYANDYIVEYIKSGIVPYNNKPYFNIEIINFDLKSEMRDIKIDEILKEKPIEFDVESIIYTDEQLKHLEKLRRNVQSKSSSKQLEEFIKEYSDNFKVGEPVFYNNHHGIITFKHKLKNPNKNSLWSVKVGDKEFRYVNGRNLTKRKVKDLSNRPLDQKLNKLTTERLLKMYKRSLVVGRGIGNIEIKRILNEREHIQKEETKIINLYH